MPATATTVREGSAVTIAEGEFVQTPEGHGRVDLIIVRGRVPGTRMPIDATPDVPAARVTMWGEFPEVGWRPVGRSDAFRVERLTPAPMPYAEVLGEHERLLRMYVEHLEYAQRAGLPSYCCPWAATVKLVFQRGADAAKGWHPVGTGDPVEGGLQRAEAFLWLATGRLYEGRLHDTELLPHGHPFRR